MDKNRFDGFTRHLAERGNRRQAIKLLLAGGVGTAAAVVGSGTEAAKPPSSASDCCPGSAPKLCGLTCTAIQSDPLNCGKCGAQCATGQSCVSGVCTPAKVKCRKAQDCPGVDDECQTRACTKGVCVYSYTPSGTAISIQTAGDCQETVCDGSGGTMIVADDTDTPTPTGDCFQGICVGGVPEQKPLASGGACGDQGFCDGNGECVACLDAGDCASQPNATAVCNTDHTCSYSCNAGFGDCTGDPGCETDMTSDVQHCGSCGTLCDIANATPVCNDGQCEIASCDAGYADCNDQADDGCEINVWTDPQNCGECGAVCSSNHGTSSCSNGVCGITCDPGYAVCKGDVDGCETNLATDVNNCGFCGHVCSLSNATSACVNGACLVESCNSGFADCNANPSDGCEVNLSSDMNNCGICGRACRPANGIGVCSGAVCSIASCAVGYGDCDGIYDNGCETQLTSNPNHCGACGNVCSSGSCVNGACA